MQFFMGDVLFKKCIENYLKKFKFETSTLDQVWEVFTETVAENLPTNITIKDIMDRWIYQSGYPLITVEIDSKMNQVTLKQVS